MKVTSVEPQKKNPKRFNVFLDGKFAFGADEDLVVNRRLIVGKEIPESDLEKLIFEAEVGKLMERMYNLFTVRQRSEKEVRDYLKALSFKRKVKDQSEISEVAADLLVSQLKRKGLLNDEQFAKAWFESRSKKYGPTRVKQELFKKGIDREIIDEVLNQQSIDQETATAEKLLEKKLKAWQNLSQLEFRKKATEFLVRRGFSYFLTKDIVENSVKKLYNKLEVSEESEEEYDN